MNKIILKESLAPGVKKIVVVAPEVARKILPGQFVVLVVDEKGERIPLTVAQADQKKGTISLIFQEVGKSTAKLGSLRPGQALLALLGPLGRATKIEKLQQVVTVGGGVGIAEVYPVTQAFKERGANTTAIIGARSKNLLFLMDEMRRVSDALFITTDDGSYGRRGFVSDVLKELIREKNIDLVYAVGPVAMMQAIAEITRPDKIKTLVSLNPIMVDATGMCGSCRVSVGGETRFGCVDGPEFDAHLVDFAQLNQRLNLFKKQEDEANESKGSQAGSKAKD